MEDSRFSNRPVNPLDERKHQGSRKSFLGSIYGRIALILYNGTTDKAALAESDGKLMASLYGKAGSTSTAIGVESSTGEQRMVMIGHDGSALQRIKTETSREVAISNYGKTSGGTATAQRVDAAGFIRNREFEPFENVAVTPLNTTATTFYTVPASTVAVVEVEFSNTDIVVNTLDFHIVPSAGAAAIGNQLLQDVALAAASVPIRLGPYHAGAGVTFQALVTTAGGANGDINALAIVKEYGTGDAVAL